MPIVGLLLFVRLVTNVPERSQTAGLRLLQDIAQPIDKIVTILIIFENFSTLDTAYNNMVQGTGGGYP